MITKYFKKSVLRTALIALPMLAAGLLQSCSEEEPFFAASENDYPRILNTELQGVNEDGSMMALPDINRDENFVYGIIATPRDYTTIDWYIDGKHVYTGDSIDMPLLAGDYIVKVTATTTKGLSTYRERTLHVEALAGDPSLSTDAASRWINPGSSVTINGSNLTGITKLYIGDVEVTDFINNGSSLSFKVPENVSLGSQSITVETADGTKYGCGKATVSEEKYVAPGVETIVLFEGDKAVPEWTCEEMIGAQLLELVNSGRVHEGTPLTIEFERTAADYCSIVFINSDWNGILTGGNDKSDVGRGDISPADGQTSITIELPAIAMEMIQKGFFITGHGYSIKKVYVEVEALGMEKTLWEGDLAMPDWSAQDLCSADVVALVEKGTIKVGTTINIYGSKTADDYCSVAVINSDWESIITGLKDSDRGDLNFGDDKVVSFTIGEEGIACIKKSGFFLAGHGYSVTKITYE